MSTANVMIRIREYVRENFLYMRPGLELGDDDHLLGNGVIDSMGILELTEFLAKEFGLEIGDHEITESNLGTLRSITRYVESKRVRLDSTAYERIGVN